MVGDVDRICADCGAVTEPDEDFCGECGTYLEWEERPVAVAQVTEPAAEPAVEPGARSIAERVKSAIGIGDEQDPPGPATDAPVDAPVDAKAAAPMAGQQAPVAGSPDPSTPPTAPVKPGAAAPRAKRRAVTQDREPIHPGDLVCGECGAGNKPTRKFCRRCGHDLKEAEVAKVPWWRRFLPRRPTRVQAAGDRPRARRSSRLRIPRRPAGVVLVLALLGGGGYLARGPVLGLSDTVVDRVKGTTKLNPDSMESSSSRPGHGAKLARDGFVNRYWAPSQPRNSFLVAHFDEPFRLVYLNIAPGVDAKNEDAFLAHGRPREIKVTVTREDGASEVKTIELEDDMGFQQFHVPVSDATDVKLEILRSYRPRAGTAIAEVEFHRRK